MIIRLSGKDPRCWALMPLLTERVINSAIRFNQANFAQLVEEVVNELTRGGDKYAVWMDVHDWKITAHLLVHEDWFNGRKIAYIEHFVADKPVLPADSRMVWTEMESWARSRGCTEVFMVTNRLNRVRAWERRYGMKMVKAVMTRELPP